MKDSRRYTLSAALHVVTCLLMDEIAEAPAGERGKLADMVAKVGTVREDVADLINGSVEWGRKHGVANQPRLGDR